MKFVCGECQAKYQIPDERVVGRKLKIRCRKCGASIAVRGDRSSLSFAPAPDDGMVWHVAIDGEQHGPYPTDQMASMLREGQLDWEATVWRDGYADWKSADQCDTLVRAVTAEAFRESPSIAPESRSSSPSIVPEYDDDQPTRMVQHLLPADDLQPLARKAFATRSASHRPAATTQPGTPVATAPAPVQSVSVAPSVAVVAVRPLSVPPPAAVTSTPSEPELPPLSFSSGLSARPRAATRGGYASGEGSGLIDIRSLAALAQSGQSRPAPLSVKSAARANGASPLGGPKSPFAHVDSIAPFERPSSAGSRAIPIAIVVGSTMIAAAAFLGVYLTRDNAPAPVAAVAEEASEATVPAPVVAVPIAAPIAAPAAPAAPAALPSGLLAVTSVPAPAAEAPEVDATSRKTAASHGAAKSKGSKAGEVAAKATASDKSDLLVASDETAAPKPSIDDLLLGKPEALAGAADPAKAKLPPANRSLDALLDGAVAAKKALASSATPESSGPALSATPSRDDVLIAMRGIESEVRACAADQTLDEPLTNVQMVVVGTTGRVQSVRVTGNQGVVGSCIARVVRGAKFAAFSRPQFTINYPFKLR